jgi:hypothetical protein
MAELVKPAQVNARTMAKAVMEAKDPLRTKYLLYLGFIRLGLVGLWIVTL